MPISRLFGLTGLAKPLTSEEGRRILERDRYRCQYCGLEGMSSFENSLIMTVDFVHPRAHKGRKDPENLLTACRPCNVIKGRRIFRDFEHARAYVLQRREALRKDWEAQPARQQGKSATGEM
jgi:5-methylcytosine-specific restriction endonuclease McrA